MATAILAACVLVCPLVMLGRMWMMRGNRSGKGAHEE